MNNALPRTPDLSADDKRRLLERLLRDRLRHPATIRPCAHHLLQQQADRSPDAVALRAPDGSTLTYHQLNARANRLARLLRRRGVGPDRRVGICLPRCAELVVGLWAILKAGGAYVPLDPDYPPDRLAFLIEDAGIEVLLTHSRVEDRLPFGPARVLRLDDPGLLGELEGEDGTDFDSGVVDQDLAYVIYTSGSTGRPKGVMIPHRGLVNYLTWAIRAYPVAEGQGAPVHSSISFDLTVTGLFLPLLAGRTVHLLDEQAGPDALADALRHGPGFSLVKITPAHLEMLSRQLRPEEAAGRTRAFIIGGEALHGETLAFWRNASPETLLINEYGPTEATVGCCIYQVPPGEPPSGPIPIGRPIANTQLYVLDAHLRPTPPGVPGELFIGGDGLARGYLHRPALTAAAFLPDPFSPAPGQRLYRTGDRARWRHDGTLEFLGRLDHQLKLRGFRIEPGEVEAALRAVPGVRDALVTTHADRPDAEPRLVAYVVAPADAGLSADSVRQALRRCLPEYMVPAAVVRLDAWPLTPNGKLDRAALPAPTEAGSEGRIGWLPPRGPIESAVAQVWSEVLGVRRVGAVDDFFELGGHSLLTAQVQARLREVFGVEVSLRDLFDAPTVAAQAILVQDALRSGTGIDVPPLVPVPRDPPVPASFAQQRLWLHDQLEPGSAVYNVPAVVEVKGNLDVGALTRAIAEIVARHEALRTAFAHRAGTPLQVIAPHIELPLEQTDLRDLAPPERDHRAQDLIRHDVTAPFRLEQSPLLRVRLLRLADDEFLVALVLHHIIADGWSIGVLIREVAALYHAFHNGQVNPLPLLPIQYPDFAAWQRTWLSGDRLRRLLDYWTDRLRGLVPLELPTDRPRPPRLSHRGAMIVRTLPPELLEPLHALGRDAAVTPFMTLLAAFQALLLRYSGQADLAVGTPVAGRPLRATEDLIGFFVNTLVLRTDLGGDPSFRALLGRVREVALGAYAHQEVPFERLVEELQPVRDPGRSPLFQVMFIFQSAPMPPLEMPGLALKPLLDVDTETSKFDLCLSVQETEAGLAAMLEYSTDLFEGTTAERLLGQYQTLLEAALKDPDQRLSQLPLLGLEEQRQLLRQGENVREPSSGLPEGEAHRLLSRLDQIGDGELDSLLNELLTRDTTAHE